MKIINKILALFIGLAFVSGMVSNIYAVTSTISITTIPDYVREQGFGISYSAITDDVVAGNPDLVQVQFYVKKDGGSYISFGSIQNGASGQVVITGAEMGESDKEYCFKATLINESKDSNETCTTYDQSAPGQPQNYSKERVSPGLYRVHWKNPGDDDFSRVFIYRSDESGFNADGSHKIGELGGAKDEERSWDDNGIDANKEYYYALRSVDKAGNVSGIVGDAGVIYEQTIISSTPLSQGSVVLLPKQEESEGEVLSAETQAPQTLGEKTSNLVQNIAQFAKDRTKITIGIGLGILLIIGLIVYISKKNNK